MNFRFSFAGSIFWAVLFCVPTGLRGREGVTVDYARDVRPLLSRHCYVCHGPDPGSRESGLRLDQVDSAREVLESGQAAIIPGDPTSSELIRRVTTSTVDERMPPVDSGHTLTSGEIEILRRWISDGAPYDEHWSFRRLDRSELPEVIDREWPRNAIDRFILASLEARGIEASPEASKATLIRRLTLDLTGLPPTPSEVAAFVDDGRDDAYEQTVDRLLASPRFGERWGRHWLDLAHYADSDGYLGDALRPNAWLFRDWVISAFNSDMPFDRFTLEQLAGDLLPDATISTKTATGFLRNTLRNTEAGVDLEEYRLKEMVDRVSTIGAGWLGLSVACAECHAHKYDPISQREFYGLLAFLNDADDVDLPVQLPEEEARYQRAKEIWDKEDKALRAAADQAISSQEKDSGIRADEWFAAVVVEVKKRSKEQKALLAKVEEHSAKEVQQACRDYEKHFAKKPVPPATKIMSVAPRKSPRETYVHLRGDYRSRGEQVKPGTPAVLPPLQQRAEEADRLDLARWLVDSSNPLTPRVTVNQLWAHLFGRGLVASVDNFGVGGSMPSHPELLDWLAGELMARGWSRKDLVRLIVCSATYRQSASPREDLSQVDPSNVLIARQSRLRLEAETIRDATLFAAGLLENRIGGPGIRPPQPAYVTSISRNADWKVTDGGELYRRGIYIVLRRATPYPMLLTFDAPDSTIACPRRERSNSPLQALTLLNDPVFFECAQALGHWLASQPSRTTEERLQLGFERCLGRQANASELERIRNEFDQQLDKLQANREAAVAIVRNSAHDHSARLWQTTDDRIIEEAAWVLIARVIMNVDEFITRE